MRQRLILILVNAAIFVALLAGLEAGVRMIQTRRLGPKAFVQPGMLDRWTAWRNTPGYARTDIEHNGEGFRRSSEVTLEKPANTVRVFLVGGSAAYGVEGQYRSLDPDWQKLYNKDLIDVYLESKLRQGHPERRWEVINAAVPEYRMHQELILLYAQILQYHPDLVIFMDGHNDMSGVMSAPEGPYNPFTSTPHELEFDTMTRPKSLRSLFYINSQWLRANSAFFDLLYRKALDRIQPNAFGPGVNPNEPVTSPVQFAALSPADQKTAQSDLARVGYYVEAAERLQVALAQAHVPTLFSLQPELLTTSKHLTPVEAKFADYTRQVNQRLRTYLWEQLRPAISSQMTEAAQRDHFTFVDLEDTLRDVREKAFTDYCHLTPRGNERIAEQLYRTMEPALTPQLIGSTAH
jgi:lysophospholipase L1-like esterase